MSVSNSPAAILNRLRGGYVYRAPAIIELCRGRDVLHLGFLGHADWEGKRRTGAWLHEKLVSVGRRVAGIDYLPSEVKKASEKFAYEGYPGDVSAMGDIDIPGRFELIVCGELIEHLANPGLMLQGIKRFMKEDAQLMVTTPNPWYIGRINLTFAYKEPRKLNAEHVGWFSFYTLKNLLQRHGFSEVAFGYYAMEYPPAMASLRGLSRRALIALTPRKCHRGIFFVAKQT